MRYSIGTNLDNNLIFNVNKLINKYNVSKNDIEFFGSFPGFNLSINRFTIIGKTISFNDFIKHIKCIHTEGYTFRFVINEPNITFDKEVEEKISFIVDTLLENNCNSYTIYNYSIVVFLLKKYGDKINIGISTINRIDSINDINVFFNILKGNYLSISGIDKIILSHGVNYSFNRLIPIIKYLKKYNIATELVGNEFNFCDKGCNVSKCLIYIDKSSINNKYNKKAKCSSDKYKYNITNLNFIRPEDIFLYEKIGIKYIKLSLRKESTIQSIKVIEKYFSRKCIGNMLDMLNPEQKNDYKGLYFDNKKLNNFLFYKLKKGINDMNN